MGRPGEAGRGSRSHTFCIHRLFHDDLHALHVVPVPEAIQGLAVLVSERQDLSHGLAGRRRAVLQALLRPSGLTGSPHSREGPHSERTPRQGLTPWGVKASQPRKDSELLRDPMGLPAFSFAKKENI